MFREITEVEKTVLLYADIKYENELDKTELHVLRSYRNQGYDVSHPNLIRKENLRLVV